MHGLRLYWLDKFHDLVYDIHGIYFNHRRKV